MPRSSRSGPSCLPSRAGWTRPTRSAGGPWRWRNGPAIRSPLVGAVHARHQVAGAPEGVTERLALGTRMIELAGAVGRFDTAMWGHLWRIDAAYQLGSSGPSTPR